jgi:hypothetical protein
MTGITIGRKRIDNHSIWEYLTNTLISRLSRSALSQSTSMSFCKYCTNSMNYGYSSMGYISSHTESPSIGVRYVDTAEGEFLGEFKSSYLLDSATDVMIFVTFHIKTYVANTQDRFPEMTMAILRTSLVSNSIITS